MPETSGGNGLEIAIVGMAGRFPGAPDLRGFWRNLCAGVESVSPLSDEELLAAGIPPELLADPAYVKAAVLFEDPDLFDAALFDIPPREAEMIDPQQRLLLECAFEALERAGYAGTSRPTGVFAGTSLNTYLFQNLISRPEILATVGHVSMNLASAADFIATRLSYKLNLTGPAVTVQTACSTSLVAVHLACQSLLAGECELALAGGASVRALQKTGYLYQPGSIYSPDGHCRPFDARGQGIVSGQGVGVVVLKLLADALADGDHIHAVIRGSAVNNDGSGKAGFTAPSREGQAAAIRAALLRAEVEAGSIGYVEAHGTATRVGDPIEVAALEEVFRESTERRQFCPIGSVKSNIGHLDAAAGIAGLIKTVLALEHGALPPSLNFERPNPEIDFASSPFYVNARIAPWTPDGAPRRAGVTSLGLGGTNAHVILEEAPAPEPSGPSRPWQLVVLSARTATALDAATAGLARWLEESPGASLPDAAYTLRTGRRRFEHRRALVCRDAGEARRMLAGRDPREVWTTVQDAQRRPAAFLFPGVGDHYPGMARGLYESEPVFRREIDLCAEILAGPLGCDLREAIFANGAGGARAGEGGPDLRRMLGRGAAADEEAARRLHRTLYAQPAVFAVEHALARLWMSWGVFPEAMLGYSLGEYVAACLAGVFSLAGALELVATRARLIEELPAGAMLAVPLAEDETRDLLSGNLCVAALNGPRLTVVSGPEGEIADLAGRLAGLGEPARRLPAGHAFHSRMMEPVAGALEDLVARLRPEPPAIPYLSNVTGSWITPGEAVDPGYWSRHLLGTVRFSRGLEELWSDPARVLLEVGPGNGLSSLALQHPAAVGGRIAVPSLPHAHDRRPDQASLLGALGRLWSAGVEIDWAGFHAGERRRRVPLPAYPFERRRHWIARAGSPAVPAKVEEAAETAASPHVRSDLRPAYTAPRPGAEARVAGAFGRLLGIADVGRDDSFFELGGNSLVGTRLISLLRAELGVELTIEALFAAPTVAALAERVDAGAAAGPPPIVPLSRQGELPLSFAQERFWFLEQLLPGTSVHNIPGAIRLSGAFDRAAFGRALTEVVRRHEVLRAAFPEVGGAPAVRIAPPGQVPLPAADLSGLPAGLREAEARRLAAEEPRRPFDLAAGPLLRATLLRLDAAGVDHLLLLNLHHMVADGWSLGVLNDELAALYGAFAGGGPSPLADLRIQYADYAASQRRWLEGPALAAGLSYWTARLGSAGQVLELPSDRPRPPVETLRGARRPLAFPPSLAARLSALGRARNATLFMTLLAALDVLLRRLTGQADLTVGTPISGRTRTEVEGLIGPFINTLALRVDLAGDPAFGELLERVKEAAVGAYAHQDVPFEKLVETLRPDRDLGRSPVFQVLFILQNAPAGTLSAPGLALRPLDVYHGVARFDLTLTMSEAEGDLAGFLEYKTDLVDASTAGRWAGYLANLLAAAAAGPDRRISELPVLGEAESHQVLAGWNATRRDFPEADRVHRLIERQAARTPGAVAVVAGETGLTYRELDQRANRLARHLRRLGVGPETLVGVCLERSPDLPVALLGVLKAGGAYLPLDPSYPAERLAFMLEDSAAPVVIVQEALRPALPPVRARLVSPGDAAGESAEALAPAALAGNLCYVLYTSGSTGRPKGVQVPHGALTNFLLSMRETPGMAADGVLAAVTSLSFDIAGLDLFLPLLAGARLILAGREEAQDGWRLAALLARHGATVLQATPATWRLLVASGWPGDRRLKALCGGEALPESLAADLLARVGELWNLYGPTETTVYSTLQRITPGGGLFIGRPAANTRTYVLDVDGQPAAPGVPGELLIGGDGVTRGYLGRPELTAERFVPDPFGPPGARLYRTGDLARWRPTGELDFLGRLDHQVKVRGFRIELGEIENALGRHGGVAHAVAAVRPGPDGQPRLVAYVVAREGAGLDAAGLSGHLRTTLPDYMLPSGWVFLDRLPLTPNGKVDRKALPAPEAPRRDAFTAPRTVAEELIAGVWADVLRVPRVGAGDDFFALGGHSLLAAQAVARLRAALGVELPVRALFEAPTVAALASRAEALRSRTAGEAAPSIRPAPRTGEEPLSFAQERLWFLDRLQPGSTAYNIRAALELRGTLRAPLLAATLSEIARRHEPLRTTFGESGGRPFQRIAAAGPVPLPVVDLSALPRPLRDPEAGRLAASEAGAPFALDRGPLLRASLLRLEAERHLALLAVHHIVSDDWSMGLLLREVGELYGALAGDRPSPLPELPVQYADFARWQRDWLRGETLAAEVAHWRERLAGAPPVLELPADRPRPALRRFRGGSRRMEIGAGLAGDLQAFGRATGSTLFMTLLAVFQALLARWSGQEDLVVGSPVAGRGRVETERLIGLFINTVVLRADLADGPGLGEALARAREAVLDALAHQDLPFEKLVEELRPERSLAYTPLFQVLFALQNAGRTASGETVELPGLAIVPVRREVRAEPFDLSLQVLPDGDGLTFLLGYDRDLFDGATAARLLEHLRSLLAAALEAPGRPLRELPLLTAVQRHQTLVEWNDTRPGEPGEDVVAAFARQAARAPEKEALVFGTRSLTFGELDRLADRVARRLAAAGVGPGTVAGLCVERSPAMVAALLGVLKAGGAWLPLDPAYPDARLALLLADARAGIGVPVLIAEEALRGRLAGFVPAETLTLGLEELLADGGTAEPVEPRASAGDPAYLIYTSGTTGVPKAVVVERGHLASTLRAVQEAFGFSPRDRMPCLAPFSFDIFLFELFGPLLAGGTAVLFPLRPTLDVQGLAARLGEMTRLHAVPALMRGIVEAARRAGPWPGMRRVFVGGDAVPPDLLAEMRPVFPEARITVLYGPTEATIVCCAHEAGAEDAPAGPLLGRPLPNSVLRVADPRGEPVPVGTAGELLIGGGGVARGYLGRPELDAERFVTLEGRRFYRSGDLARHRPDGRLEFLGRLDDQVKVRGFRVEPGEIEAAIARQPGVRAAVATVAGGRLAAYVVPAPERPDLALEEIRRAVARQLPEHMVPGVWTLLESLPLSPNGKVDRRALPSPEARQGRREGAEPASGLEREIAAIWREVLGVDRVGVGESFFDLGGHSLLMARVQSLLAERLGREVPMVDLFGHPTVGSLAGLLAAGRESAPLHVPPEGTAGPGGQEIAIVGMAGRFPGARDVEAFWRNLRAGVEAVTFLADEELIREGAGPELLADPGFVKAAVLLEDADLFDAAFFDVPPREAETIDPQQRLFLECGWEALERAGYAGTSRTVGVFAGASQNTYLLRNILQNPEAIASVGAFALTLASEKDFLATRLSYKLGLEGPGLTIQTACSTSLVAVHVACQSLLAGECELALAGGAAVRVPQKAGYHFQPGGINSPDGHCRAFDARARGTIAGQGVGVVVLKRLADALADGDTVHAVIKGSAINNDGSLKAGFTAPRSDGQARAIRAAQLRAKVEAGSIGYVEAHGTGTQLGDPIEVAALTRAFRESTARRGFCALGSLKTNIGHLDAAAGIAGLIKTALVLERREIPPSLHFETPNPEIDFAASPFYVNDRLRAWPAGDSPRRAAVSSFGIGGTNAHAILEEAPPAGPSGPSRPWQLLLLSARSAAALEESTDRLAAFLAAHPEASLPDVAYTLQVGRGRFEHRRMLVCSSPADALAALEARDPERLLTRFREPARRPVVLLFPGQGAQHAAMGRGLYATEEVFRREVDLCAGLLRPHLGRDLREILAAGDDELRETRFAQPALFVLEHALARLLLSWGIEPWAMIGHSVGEYVAACLAGVFALEDALALVAARGELLQGLPGGAMLSVDLPEDEVRALLPSAPGLSLAAVNAPGLCAVAGPEPAVAALEASLRERGAACRRLHTSHAFHSAMMDPVLDAFAERVERTPRREPTIPYLSNLTGDWITAAEATDPAYWARHLRETVRFGDGVAKLLAEPEAILVEVGPGGTLSGLARRQAAPGSGHTVATMMRHPRSPEPDEAVLLQGLGRLWLAGAGIDWAAFHAGERRRRVVLPTYPFQRRRYWIEPSRLPAAPGEPAAATAAAPAEPLAGHSRPDLATAYAPPRDETERRLAEIWQRLLGIGGVGVHDDFFELGGHSLLATQVLSRVREELGVEVSLDAFFAASTVAGLARAVAGAPRAGDGPQAPPLRPMPRDGAVPLSFAQQRLWFLDQLAPGGNAYNMAMPLRLTGRLDPAALERALNEVVRRHEALRTAFGSTDGEPFQAIAPEAVQALPLVDLAALPAAAREAALRAAVTASASLPFDLERGPLFRTVLARTGDGEHALLIAIHHIVSDGWSMGVLINEVAALYTAFLSGGPPPLPALPIQYADFAIWQREWLQGEALESLLAYWRTAMAGAPAALELPTDRPRPPVQTFNGALRTLRLSRETSDAVRALGQARGATPFMVLLAAFKTLLGRSSGQPDVVVGTPVANRNRAETEGLIGFFANTLLTRTRLEDDPPFEALVDRVRTAAVGAFTHQDMPFERLVEELRPQRDVSRQPLFQVMFALQNTPASGVEAPGLALSPIQFGEPAEHFDLTLFVHETAGGAFLPALRYNTDLFDGATATRMLERFRILVEGAVAEPGRALLRLPLLSAAERHHLLHGCNDAGPVHGSGGLVHELIRERARLAPDAPAVIGEEERLTYRELDERADRLARGLAALGAGPETLVGLCLPRQPEMIVAILAVLKAGGAYLPLDPAYPRERIGFMLRQGGARLLLTRRELLAGLPEHGARAVCLDDGPLAEGPAAPGPLAADQAAYVIFTSGSTGRPKGAVLTHANLRSYVAALGGRLGIGEDDVYLHTASFSFSSSVRQMMLPLCRGAALVLASQERIGDPLLLLELIRRRGVTVADLVPSYWRGCLRALEETDEAHRRELLDNRLRLLVSASETLLPDVPAGWRRLGQGARLVNMLGQTETTGIVSVHPIPPPGPGRTGAVPVGRPIPGAAIYLLDGAMEPVPLGVPGEVYIGGTGVGRGYLGRPGLTAGSFVPDAWSGEPGARLYRTGDLARRLPDGNLEHIGRRDQQVKIRGFRIETGEVEAALNRHPAVRESVVLARAGLLAAWFVPADGTGPAAADLRGFLQGILPEYMVPGVFTALPALPLTPTGKVDRAALPDVDPARSRRPDGRVPPRTEKERVLAGIWAQVLRVEEIGVEDDFFELGGHSLLAAQVVSRIRGSLRTEVPVRLLFEKPTVAALAAALSETPAAPGPVRAVRKVERAAQAKPGSTQQLSDAEVERLLRQALEKKRKTS